MKSQRQIYDIDAEETTMPRSDETRVALYKRDQEHRISPLQNFEFWVGKELRAMDEGRMLVDAQ